VVDAGAGRAAERWLARVQAVVALDKVAAVFITHYHADHAGGAAAGRAAGLTVVASRTTAAALETADEAVTSLDVARAAGVYPADYRLEPARGVGLVEPGPWLELPGLRLSLVDAPGHCDGHLALVADSDQGRDLFSGDVVFADGRISVQALHDCRLQEYGATVARLAALRADRLFPGHGPWQGAAAADWLDRAAASFAALIPPPNLLVPPGF